MDSEQVAARVLMQKLISELDDESFAWLALAVLPWATTLGGKIQIWPDGLGGFRDRERIEQIRAAAKTYLEC